jgi:hypothetical protein
MNAMHKELVTLLALHATLEFCAASCKQSCRTVPALSFSHVYANQINVKSRSDAYFPSQQTAAEN